MRDISGRIAIAGAGMTGAYLYRLLKNRGGAPEIFDTKTANACGLTPCAWGTSADFAPLVAAAGLSPGKYLLSDMDHLVIDDLRVKLTLSTFDKPALIADLLGDARVSRGPIPAGSFDRIIDATGTARAFLPPIPDDIRLECCQHLVESATPLGNRVRITRCGYAWCFPLSKARYHVGCGSLDEDPASFLQEIGWLGAGERGAASRALCGCRGAIRLTGPRLSTPFVTQGNPSVWGVGEAIGCVAPLVGDGVVPGMRSVELLLRHWNDPDGYREAVLTEFGWMDEERAVVDALKKGIVVGVREAGVLLRNSRRMKLQLGIREVLGILRILSDKYLLAPRGA